MKPFHGLIIRLAKQALWVSALSLLVWSCGPSDETQFRERKWKDICAADDLGRYTWFLDNFPKLPGKEKADVASRAWSLVRVFDAVPAYDYYLEKFPGSPPSDQARTRRTELCGNWPEPLRSSGQIRLAVEASGYSGPLEEFTADEWTRAFIKRYFGLQTVSTYDAALPSLEVSLFGDPISAEYRASQGGTYVRLYSGATVQGKIVFRFPGRPDIGADFAGVVRPPATARPSDLSRKLRSDAPFEDALEREGSLAFALVDMLAKGIHPDPLFYFYVRSGSPCDPAIDMSDLLLAHQSERIAGQLAEWIKDRTILEYWQDAKELYGLFQRIDLARYPKAVSILERKLRSEERTESFWPLIALSAKRHPEAVEKLLQACAERDPNVAGGENAPSWDKWDKAIVLRALGECGDRRALDPIGHVLRTSRHWEELEAALEAAAELGGEEAVRLLRSFQEGSQDLPFSGLGDTIREALEKARRSLE